jgi:hypothetical protein
VYQNTPGKDKDFVLKYYSTKVTKKPTISGTGSSDPWQFSISFCQLSKYPAGEE